MNSFLSLLADEVLTLAGSNFHRYCIVLPSRRASLFLKKEFEKRIQRPVILPPIYSFEDFIYAHTPFEKPEPYEDLTILWKAVQKVTGLSGRSFDEMIDWGQVVINDFNEVDAYLIDPSTLFKYLENIRKYEIWGRNEGEVLSNFQRLYLEFYKSLEELYTIWSHEMQAAGLASPGGAARWLAQNIPSAHLDRKYEKIIFAGLNALTPAEERIISYFENNGKAILRYDADQYYLNDKLQEAGLFLRQRINLEKDKYIGNYLIDNQRNINITGVPGNVSQVRFLHQYLCECIEREGTAWLEKTAIVLADESLLIPLMQALPGKVGSINITMGLPLSYTPAGQLVQSFLSYTQEARPQGIHLSGLAELLMHPWIRSKLAHEKFYPEIQLTEWTSMGFVWMNFHDLDQKLLKDSSIKDWLRAPDDHMGYTPRQTLKMLQALITWQKDFLNNTIQEEFLFSLALLCDGVERQLGTLLDTLQLKTLGKLLQRLIANTKIPFSGEPLEGLQIMGMLETRALDFETVILLSASDDILPGSGRTPTFIPFDVRLEKSFGLPVFTHKNAITAYHFYRLLQRCNEAVIFYNNQAGDLGKTGEMSRFLQQIKHEFQAKNANTLFRINYPSLPLIIDKEESKEFRKTEEVIKSLDSLSQKGFSASALWTFIQCQYKFYLDYILGLRNRQTDPLESAPLIFGKVVHGTLNNFYENPPVILKPDIYDFSKINDLIDRAFQETVPGADIHAGHLRLIRNAAEKFVRRFLEAEKKSLEESQASIEIIALEKKYTHTLDLSKELHPSKTVFIQGIFDRLEIYNGTLRILDYKTGRVEPANLRLQDKNMHTFPNKPDWEKLFQLMVYKWLYFSSEQGSQDVEVGIIPLKASSYTVESASFEVTGDFVAFAENILKETVTELLNPDHTFIQTTQKKVCHFCPYRLICGRLD